MSAGPINRNRPGGLPGPSGADAVPTESARPDEAGQRGGTAPTRSPADQFHGQPAAHGPTLSPQLAPPVVQQALVQQALAQPGVRPFREDPAQKGTFTRQTELSRVPPEVLDGADVPRDLPPTTPVTELREGERLRWQVHDPEQGPKSTRWFGPEDLKKLVDKLKAARKEALRQCPDPALGHGIRSFYDERIAQLEEAILPVSLAKLKERVAALLAELKAFRERLTGRRVSRRLVSDLAALTADVTELAGYLDSLPEPVSVPMLLQLEGHYCDFAAQLFHLKDELGLATTQAP